MSKAIVKMIFVIIVSSILVSCRHSNVLLRNDDKITEINSIRTKLTTAEAIEIVRTSISNYYKPKNISVNENGYEFSIGTDMVISGGIQKDGRVPLMSMNSGDRVYRLKFNDVIGIETNRWGAADDAIAFWSAKRFIIYLLLANPEETYGNNNAGHILCYDYDRERVIASLLLLCRNLKQ